MLISSLFNFISNLGWVYIPDACVHDKSCDLVVFLPVALMGISYGIFAGTAWNALCYLVRQDQVGMTLGIASCLLSLGLAIVPPIMGSILD